MAWIKYKSNPPEKGYYYVRSKGVDTVPSLCDKGGFFPAGSGAGAYRYSSEESEYWDEPIKFPEDDSPQPAGSASGVPWCSEQCKYHDGKRCELIGGPPVRIMRNKSDLESVWVVVVTDARYKGSVTSIQVWDNEKDAEDDAYDWRKYPDNRVVVEEAAINGLKKSDEVMQDIEEHEEDSSTEWKPEGLSGPNPQGAYWMNDNFGDALAIYIKQGKEVQINGRSYVSKDLKAFANAILSACEKVESQIPPQPVWKHDIPVCSRDCPHLVNPDSFPRECKLTEQAVFRLCVPEVKAMAVKLDLLEEDE